MAKPTKSAKKYISKGERRNVSRSILKDMHRHSNVTHIEAQLDAFIAGKRVVIKNRKGKTIDADVYFRQVSKQTGGI